MTTFRRRADGAYGIIAAAAGSYVAIVDGESSTIAARYDRGTYVADLAETTDLSFVDGPVQTTLFEGRYLIAPHSDSIEVWDLVTNVVSTYNAPGGRFIVGAAALGAAIYWVEVPGYDWIAAGPGWQSTLYLRSADLDLGSPWTAATVDVGDSFHWEWHNAPGWFALNPAAAMVELRADDAVNHEVLVYFRARFTLDGMTSEFDVVDAADLALGLPEANGGSLALPIGGGALVRLADDVSAAPAAHWPATGEWSLGATCFSVLADLSEVGVFGGDGMDLLFLRAAVETTEGSPADRFVVGDHPQGSPSLFYFGA